MNRSNAPAATLLLRPAIRSRTIGLAITLAAAAGFHDTAFAQAISIDKRFETAGTIEAVQPGEIRLRDEAGKVATFRIQDKDEQAIVLAGSATRLRFPARIQVRGLRDTEALTPGALVRFETRLEPLGKALDPVGELDLLTDSDRQPGIEIQPNQDDQVAAREPVAVVVVGRVRTLRRNRLQLDAPHPRYARGNRLTIPLEDTAQVRIERDDLQAVRPGDRATAVTVAVLSTGDRAIEAIEIELAGEANATALAAEQAEQARYAQFSDEPSAPRDVRSRHFLLHTDVSDRQARRLLDQLETMLGLVASYYGRVPSGLIECYVVRDLSQWPDGSLDAFGVEKIARGEGVTVTRSLGRQVRSVVFSCDRPGVVQHEAVHAYYAQTFGSPGPTWYAEGMAEMGQYWIQGERAVRIDPLVAEYLATAEPPEMLDIVAAGQISGDSWKAYAWRWALCHLLANNPNYSDRFQQLGLGMMSGKEVSFESVYGAVAKQVSFEYALFVDQVANGYRADLAAWQWNHRFKPLAAGRRETATVMAAAGWQPSGIRVKQAARYRVTTDGQWQTAAQAEPVGGDGDASGRGRLEAVVFEDFQLSEPFALGSDATFAAPRDGQLFLRCRDAWNQLADNEGRLDVTLTRESERAP